MLFGDERKIVRRHQVSEIGEFVFKESSEQWVCRVDGINFEIEGDWSPELDKIKPSDKAISAAIEFFRNRRFKFQELDAFLKRAESNWSPPSVNEVSRIVFESDGTAEIQFSERSPIFWHCQYDGKGFNNLSFDR